MKTGAGQMVERAKEFWYTWIPGWMPVCGCILAGTWWISSTVTGMQRDIQSLQEQMKSVEQYLRSHDIKSFFDTQHSGVSYPQPHSPEDAGANRAY
jgi:hypothetical protein